MYSLLGYGAMIQDQVRIAAFTQALRAAVRPGAVVVDIGTGPGIMAVLACQLGASRVFAIEPDAVIQVAREVAASNGCADKIEFFEALSTRVELPVQADVIVSDMRGVLPLLGLHIPAIADARTRFLAPGGTLIARKDTIWAAPVEAPENFAEHVNPWNCRTLNQDLSPARLRIVGSRRRAQFTAEQLLGQPQLWATLDYATVEDPDVRSKLHWTIERDGVGHGIVLWFEMELADGISFSTAPGAPADPVYGSMFIPWTSPISLTAGHSVCVDLGAKLLEKDYFWRWTTQIASPETPSKVLTIFDQSDLDSMVLSPAKLGKAASTYVPKLSEEARLHLRTLELMDGKASLDQIARQLIAEFPQRFPGWQQSLSYAATVSKSYSQ
jgi:protein arginine N-methyltransferase 1